MFCVRKGSSPGPMRHQVRESAESPEWPTFASSTTTSSFRTRGAASCSLRNSFSPYCSEVIPRRKTRPSFAIRPASWCSTLIGRTIMPMFEPVSTGRVSGEIVGRIKAAIRGGALAPGDQLPPERDLTKQLGVSRVSVRDALRMLEANGLIEVRVGARGGAFVTAPAPSLVSEGFADMLRMADVSAADVTELRLVFELAMLPLAVERATPDDVDELEAICDASEAVGYDVALSARFHTRLARCTHNDALALFAESFHQPLLRSLQIAKRVAPEMGGAGTQEHRELIDAMRDRDVARAVAIMSAHLGRTAERVAR